MTDKTLEQLEAEAEAALKALEAAKAKPSTGAATDTTPATPPSGVTPSAPAPASGTAPVAPAPAAPAGTTAEPEANPFQVGQIVAFGATGHRYGIVVEAPAATAVTDDTGATTGYEAPRVVVAALGAVDDLALGAVSAV